MKSPLLISPSPGAGSPRGGLGGAMAGRAWALPVVSPRELVTPEIDRLLTASALAAQAGDRAARDALYHALAPKLAPLTARYERGYWGRIAGRAWEREDVGQEAFLVFCELIAAWPGGGSFPRYLLGHFGWRLNSAVRRLQGAGPAAPARLDPRAPLVDGSADACQALALLDALADSLDWPDGAILLGHIRDRESFGVLAHRLGINRRTVRRRWLRLLIDLRASLEPPRSR